ncbi:MAG: putative glycoside hydrolase [Candidatus Krumholzibacteriia bacterium]
MHLASLAACVLSVLLPRAPVASLPIPTEIRPLVHDVLPGDTLAGIAGRWRREAGHYDLNQALAAIRTANGLTGDLLRPGQRLVVPRAAVADHPRAAGPTRDGADLRGIYLTGPVCGDAAVFAEVDAFVRAGGNGVVFDIKDIDGAVSYRSAVPDAGYGPHRRSPVISDLPGLLHRLHDRDLYVVARLAVFLDGELGRRRPDLALHDDDGVPWVERGCTWMDPAHREVRAYNVGLAVEMARAGVDEIQLDYVRFPTNGWRGDGADPALVAARRQAVIGGFVAELAGALQPYGTRLSADLYGISAWGRVQDLALTGQHVSTIAQHVDFICPMIYPSHFEPGFEGHADPASDPEHFVGEGVRRFRDLAGGHARIRPWLQAFPWRVRGYDGTYVARQIAAAAATGADGWCLWSPSSRYGVACEGLSPVPAPAATGVITAARSAATVSPLPLEAVLRVPWSPER